MVTAPEVGLKIIEVSAILLPLMGIFMQVLIRSVQREGSGWTPRQVQIAYVVLSVTVTAVVIAGVAAMLPFISGNTPRSVLIPIVALYFGYLGIELSVIALAGIGLQREETPYQVLLSAWESGIDNE